MRFSCSRLFSISCLLSCGAALPGLGGCDPAEDWSGEGVETRSDGQFPMASGLDPIPGGGTCEECVTDSALTNIGMYHWRLDLCIDGGIKYIGTSPSPEDDIPLKHLLEQLPASEDVDWRLVGTNEATICTSEAVDECEFKKPVSHGDKVQLSIEFMSNQTPPKPRLLRFHPADAALKEGSPSPAMKIREDSSPKFKCEYILQSSPSPIPSAEAETIPANIAAPNALAHITARFAYGGVRSCSGVLITPRYVLSAGHCFAVDGAKTAAIELESTQVRFLGDGNLPAPIAFEVDRIIPHPDKTRDLALLRLQTAASVSMMYPIPISVLQPDSPDCTWVGRGFGRSRKFADSDWGKGKAIAVRPVSADNPVLDDFYPEDLAKLIVLENVDRREGELCRGDSGGPIVRTCNGQYHVVGIASARVFSSDGIGKFLEKGIEPLTSAFAFSYGNICGEGDVIAYAATRIDAEVQDWIAGVIGPPIPPEPQPVELPEPQPVEPSQPPVDLPEPQPVDPLQPQPTEQ